MIILTRRPCFRTLKYRPEYPHQGFESLEAARLWSAKFVHWYAYEHQHSGLNFVTPHQCHTGEHIEILAKRKEVYEAAKSKHPERWSGSTRDWSAHNTVALNPMKDQQRKERYSTASLRQSLTLLALLIKEQNKFCSLMRRSPSEAR